MVKCTLYGGSDIKCPHCDSQCDVCWTLDKEHKLPKKLYSAKCPSCNKLIEITINLSYEVTKSSYVKHSETSKYIIVSDVHFQDTRFKIYNNSMFKYLVISQDHGWVMLDQTNRRECTPMVFDNLDIARSFYKGHDEFVQEVEIDSDYNITQWIKRLDLLS